MTRFWMHTHDGLTIVTTKAECYPVNCVGTPVVVIDPEDEGYLDLVYAALTEHGWVPPERKYPAPRGTQTRLTDVFRSLLAPPRAEVPERGWGRNATVRDRAGTLWRYDAYTGHWYRIITGHQQSAISARWADLDVAPDGILWVGAYDEAKS